MRVVQAYSFLFKNETYLGCLGFCRGLLYFNCTIHFGLVFFSYHP